MPRQSNIAGVRFSHLVAVEPMAERKNGYTVWRCLCDCGRVARVPSRNLKNGWTTTCEDPACAFYQESMKMKKRGEDLVGRRFGKLVVAGPVLEDEFHQKKDERGRALWHCACDCGNTIIVPTGQLKAGYRKSCGCLSRPPRKDWIGKRFGMLTVAGYGGKESGKHWWKCICDCGNETIVCQSNLQNGHTVSCGCMNKLAESRTMVSGTCIESLRGAVEKKTIFKNNSSGVRGVYLNNRTGRWCAQITFKGRTRYLGSYETISEAKQAREIGEEKYFKEFLEEYERSGGLSACGAG